MHDSLLAYAAQVIGPCDVVEDHSWEHDWSTVLQLRDRDGLDWFVKQHHDADRYRAEAAAYQRWVPALGDCAPVLRAHHAEQHAVIVSGVPGVPAPWPTVAGSASDSDVILHHRAGKLLRCLHDAEVTDPQPGFAATKLADFELLAADATSLLTPREIDAARTEITRSLSVVPAPRLVPCHGDYGMRNWIVDGDRVHIIDFELARLDAWVVDLVRLSLGPWHARPDLEAAFLNGYGRELDESARVLLHGCAVFTVVWLVVKAVETAQPQFETAVRAALDRLLNGGR